MVDISRSRTRLVLASAFMAVFVFSGWAVTRAQSGPTAPADRWRQAVNDWEAGDYHLALPRLLAIMRSPAAAEYLERVALLTGDYYPSTTIAEDGRNPRLSADGTLVLFETGPTTDPMTRIVRVPRGGTGAAEPVAEFSGVGAVVNATGTQVAWIRPPQGAAGADLAWLTASAGDLVVRDLASGAERVIATPGLAKTAPVFAGDSRSILFVGSETEDLTRSDIYQVRDGAAPERLTSEPGFKTLMAVAPNGSALLYSPSGAATFRRPAAAGAAPGAPGGGRAGGGPPGGGRAGGPGGGATQAFVVLNLATKATRTIPGTGATMSADGSTIAWIVRAADAYTLNVSKTLSDTETAVRTGRERLEAPSLSADGSRVVYQMMQFTDWEIYISEGTTHTRVTRDIQHDILPRFLTNTTLIGMMGEPRHRRSQVYDLTTGTRRRLFHNNTIRTVVPEYTWLPSADGSRVLIVADRDGDTVSPERGIYVTDLSRTVSTADVIARITAQTAHETELRDRTTKLFAPIAAAVRTVVNAGSVTRVFEHAKALYDFDSKHISMPGNAKAVDYLAKAYTSFGYTPEIQSFTPQANTFGGKTANVVATLKGTVNPELIYVVSSHFDSVAIGPGADDDTSGTTALLEAARMLSKTPMPATIVFASFTGEEAGLLGSREFVRRAGEAKWNVVGALNNDMIGWAGEGPQLNNTIRYSNSGIRDIQHGAAIQFTDLVLFDTKYYRGTDAAAFYESWGDIVGGIGSYPILANPNYHQATDYLDTINQVQVTETAKVTAATLMYLASSPSRLKDLKVESAANATTVTWTASPETGVRRYIVAYGPATDPMRTRVTVTEPRASLPALPAGTQIAVKAVNDKGLEGWDWARLQVAGR